MQQALSSPSALRSPLLAVAPTIPEFRNRLEERVDAVTAEQP
jgi:hypothetical protein